MYDYIQPFQSRNNESGPDLEDYSPDGKWWVSCMDSWTPDCVARVRIILYDDVISYVGLAMKVLGVS